MAPKLPLCLKQVGENPNKTVIEGIWGVNYIKALHAHSGQIWNEFQPFRPEWPNSSKKWGRKNFFWRCSVPNFANSNMFQPEQARTEQNWQLWNHGKVPGWQKNIKEAPPNGWGRVAMSSLPANPKIAIELYHLDRGQRCRCSCISFTEVEMVPSWKK